MSSTDDAAGAGPRSSPAAGGLPLVPVPNHVEERPGAPFRLTARTRVVVGPGPLDRQEPATARPALDEEDPIGAVGRRLAEELTRLIGRPVPVVTQDDGSPGAVVLLPVLRGAELGVPTDVDEQRVQDAYRLTVDASRVTVAALTPAGLRHGLTTLEQLRETTADGEHRWPAVRVTDVPRFAWRGLSVDVARHFLDVPTICSVIDVLASLKLNVLHLHLTDDQGWRLQLPSRPQLTARSGSTAVGGGPGGYYTPADYQRILAHAADHAVTVIPEIDLPGHVNAALHAYGELTPSGEPTPEYTGIEVGFSRLHSDLPTTAPFLADVLGDVAAMTPGPYVHIGGDEVLTMAPAEYAELVRTAADQVHAAGKTAVGWQEVVGAPLRPGSVVQLWDATTVDAERLDAAVRGGARVLISPARHAYLDMKYDSGTALGLEWAGHIELRDAYEWEPLTFVPGVPTEQVAGVEAAIWSETVQDADDLFMLLLPRLAAFAEVAWSEAENRDWPEFARRVPALASRWSEAGLRWHPSRQVTW